MYKKIFLTFFAVIAISLTQIGSAPFTPGCMTFTRQITGDSDSGIGGYWAHDTYTSTYEVCPDPDGGYDVTRTDVGTFETFGGTSPSGNSTVGAGVTGSINGSWTDIHVDGTINPAANPDLGSVDYMCDENGQCANYSSSMAMIFEPGYVPEYPETWSWTYTSCNGDVWTNSHDGNSGDITAPENCPPGIQAAINGGQSCATVTQDLLTLKYTDEAKRYLAAHPFCRAWFKGYYWYWQEHKDQLH